MDWEGSSKVQKVTVLAVYAAIFGLILAACGSEPVSLDQVPVYPQATPMIQGANEMADKVLEAISESSKKQGLRVNMKLYSLPEESRWEDVKAFYEDKLVGTGWDPVSELSSEHDHFYSAGWSRGSGNMQEALTLSYVDSAQAGTAFFVVALFSR